MRKMNIKPALHYQLDYMFWASIWTFGILFAIMVITRLFFGIGVISLGESAYNDYSAGFVIGLITDIMEDNPEYSVSWFNIGAVAFFSFFIVGIAGIREDLRFFLQHGMGRYTTFFSTLWGSLICATVIGGFCELLNFITSRWSAFPMRGMTFANINQGSFAGWLIHIAIFFTVWQFGTLISLLYYRMNKIQQIVFSVGMGGLIIFGLPNFFRLSPDWISTMIDVLVRGSLNPLTVALFTSVLGILSALFNFLLIRRAEIKE